MEIKELNKKPDIEQFTKLTHKYLELGKLRDELNRRELPSGIVRSINQEIKHINSFAGSNRELLKQVRNVELRILKLIEKELKLVPKNAYRPRWMAIGMSVFGIPLGVAFGASLGNMVFLAIGIPIGMSIGIAIGSGMDKKAFEEGRQLDIEIRPQ